MAMTPKEKATQLIYAFEAFTDRDNEYEFAKQCALIAVDEIIEALEEHQWQNRHIIDNYKLVKQEIENL
jgi:hypothetical protein